MKVLAAPDLRCEGFAYKLIDWGPTVCPFKGQSLLSAALQDIVYVQDLSKPSSTQYKCLDVSPEHAVAVSFDRSAEAMAIGLSSRQTVIFDV